jgi:hypothetical protein
MKICLLQEQKVLMDFDVLVAGYRLLLFGQREFCQSCMLLSIESIRKHSTITRRKSHNNIRKKRRHYTCHGAAVGVVVCWLVFIVSLSVRTPGIGLDFASCTICHPGQILCFARRHKPRLPPHNDCCQHARYLCLYLLHRGVLRVLKTNLPHPSLRDRLFLRSDLLPSDRRDVVSCLGQLFVWCVLSLDFISAVDLVSATT